MFNSMFGESKELKYFKEIKRLKSLQKVEAYYEPAKLEQIIAILTTHSVFLLIFNLKCQPFYTKNSVLSEKPIYGVLSKLTFTCSKLRIETMEKGVKYVQS